MKGSIEQLIYIICVCGSILIFGTLSYIIYNKICYNNNNYQDNDYIDNEYSSEEYSGGYYNYNEYNSDGDEYNSV